MKNEKRVECAVITEMKKSELVSLMARLLDLNEAVVKTEIELSAQVGGRFERFYLGGDPDAVRRAMSRVTKIREEARDLSIAFSGLGDIEVLFLELESQLVGILLEIKSTLRLS